TDNGGERYSGTWPFTGRKTELLEGGLRIPAVIRWPRRIPCGVVSEQVKIGMDWFPILLAAAGSTPDPPFPSDGIDLRQIYTCHNSREKLTIVPTGRRDAGARGASHLNQRPKSAFSRASRSPAQKKCCARMLIPAS